MSAKTFENMLILLINSTDKDGLVMVDRKNVYQTKYKQEVDLHDKVIPWKEIITNREAVRELLSIATDLFFDGELE